LFLHGFWCLYGDHPGARKANLIPGEHFRHDLANRLQSAVALVIQMHAAVLHGIFP
jgi:hypothetical protein